MATMKDDSIFDNIPEEVNTEELSKLLSDLPDNVMLEILMEAGLIDRGEADG